jgi:hypothetical protein
LKGDSTLKSARPSDKSQAVLQALVAGCCCDQILAADPTLTYHDIFRATAELPEIQGTRQWSSASREGWRNTDHSFWWSAENEALAETID